MSRRALSVAVAVVLLLGLPAAFADQAPPEGPRVSPALAGVLEEAGPAKPVTVFVHGSSLDAARAAVASAGMVTRTEWASIEVVAAAGTRSQIETVIGAPGVTFVEPDQPLEYFLDTALQATRADEALSREWPAPAATDDSTLAEECTPHNGKAPDWANNGTDNAETGEETDSCESSAETLTFDGTGHSIAVVDGGVDGTHPMFSMPDGTSKVVRNLRVTCPGTSLLINTNTGQETPEDLCLRPEAGPVQVVDVPGNDSDTITAGGHGTHVAGIAAGVEVDALGTTFSGVAPGAKIVALAAGANISILGANTALDWIARNHEHPCGVDVPAEVCPPITVVNNSYGGGGGKFLPRQATVKLQRKLVELGVVMVWANGNDGGDGTANNSNRPGQDPTPGVISVANYNDGDTGTRDGSLAPSSSRGDPADVTTYPDLSAPGTSITSACRLTLTICASESEDSDYGTISGTSMAAPHVAGAVAVLQQALRAYGNDASPAAIEDLVEDTAHKFEFVGPYVADDPLRNDDSTTSFDKGHGLLDLAAAIAAGIGATDSPPPSSACVSRTVELSDPTGDGTAASAPNDPALDVVHAALTADRATRDVTLVITVDDLPATPGGRGERWITGFWVGTRAHEFDVQRLPGSPGPHFRSVDGNGAGSVTFDAVNDTITYRAHADVFDPPLDGKLEIDGFTVSSLNASSVVVGVYADDAAASCPGSLDVRTKKKDAAAADPEAGTGDGRVSPGAGQHAWTGTPPVPVNPMPLGALICTGPNDPRCDHHVLEVALEGATTARLLVEVAAVAAGDDFDVFLWGPDGALVGDAATSDDPELIEVAVTTPGLYTVSVAAFATLGDPYAGSAQLVS